MRTAVPPQQKDNLCGPYWIAGVLVDAGFSEWDGQRIDQDLVALHAGTTLPPDAEKPCVPPGATSLTGYRFELPFAPEDESGTPVEGLVAVVEQASRGALVAVPIRGKWTAERVERLVAEAERHRYPLIANVRTGKLWGSHAVPQDVEAELDGRHVDGPPPDWDVGHYIELSSLVRGRGGSLVGVHDTYPTLGAAGAYVVPPRAVAAALLRGDGREGGILAVVPRSRADALRRVVVEIGLEVGLWNNGSRRDADGDR